MKRFIYISLTILILLSFAGCNNDADNSQALNNSVSQQNIDTTADNSQVPLTCTIVKSEWYLEVFLSTDTLSKMGETLYLARNKDTVIVAIKIENDQATLQVLNSDGTVDERYTINSSATLSLDTGKIFCFEDLVGVDMFQNARFWWHENNYGETNSVDELIVFSDTIPDRKSVV